MVRKNPIICPCCKENSGYNSEDFSHFVITGDILCKKCGGVVIKNNPSIELRTLTN